MTYWRLAARIFRILHGRKKKENGSVLKQNLRLRPYGLVWSDFLDFGDQFP